MGRLILWTAAAATLGVYCIMVLWSLPRVAAEAGGLPPFDMRPFGYAEGEARAFLASLSPQGRSFYGRVQHGLDIAFPALLALVLVMSFDRLISAPGLRWLLTALALGSMAADYAENALVSRMLLLPPSDVPAALIGWSNAATLTKSATVTAAMTALLVALAARIRRRRI